MKNWITIMQTILIILALLSVVIAQTSTSDIDVGSTNNKEVGSTNNMDVGSTNNMDVGSTSNGDVGSTSNRDAESTSAMDVGSTNNRDVGSTSDMDVGSGNPKMSNCKQGHKMRKLRLYMMGIVPKCDENGDLLSLQCYERSKHCVCVQKNGNVVNKASSNLKGCDCIVGKYEGENSGLLGSYVPQCEEDGTYKKMQCHYSTGYCNCADPTTGKNTTEPSRNDVICD